jgi:hypothetical protein
VAIKKAAKVTKVDKKKAAPAAKPVVLKKGISKNVIKK